MPGDDLNKTADDGRPESNAELSSSEETAVKRSRPNPPASSQIKIATTRAVTPEPGALPLWVAGSSPAKFISLDDLIRVNSGLEKMAIAHEIAIDPNFKLEAHVPQNSVEKAVSEQMRRAYWDLLRVDLQKTPPEYQHAFTLVKDIKELIMDLLVLESHAQLRDRIESILDLDLLQHQFETRSVEFHKLLTVIVETLAGLCAPVRDELVAKLNAEQDDVDLIKGIFELLEHMKVDMANFTLNQNRGTIERFSAEYEREQFMKALEVDPDGATGTATWLSLALDEYIAEKPHKLEEQEIARSELGDIFSRGYMRLLEPVEASVPFPETLALDKGRIEGLSEKYLQLILTSASVFVTSNLAGRQIGERSDFKQQLKSQLIVILNDVTWTNYPEKMENVALQCEKLVAEAAGDSWTKEQSAALKEQVVSLAMVDHPVRKIARDRIRGFVRSIVRAPGAASIQLPAGMSVIQSELAAFTSKFLLITSHNWKAFGVFYAKLVEAAFKRRLQAHRSGPSVQAGPVQQSEKTLEQSEKTSEQSEKSPEQSDKSLEQSEKPMAQSKKSPEQSEQ